MRAAVRHSRRSFSSAYNQALSDAETVCTRPVPSRCTTAGNLACSRAQTAKRTRTAPVAVKQCVQPDRKQHGPPRRSRQPASYLNVTLEGRRERHVRRTELLPDTWAAPLLAASAVGAESALG